MERQESPLNMAHAEGRKAERCEKAHKLSDAIKCHIAASEFLTEATDNTADMRAIESLKLQQEYHRRQIALIEHRQKFQVKQKENVSNQSSEYQHALNQHSSKSTQAIKTANDRSMVIEELKMQNAELHSHILKVLHENRQQASDIEQLRTYNNRMRESTTRDGSGTNVDSTLVENESNIDLNYEREKINGEVLGKLAHCELDDSHNDSEEEDKYFKMVDAESGELPPLQMPEFDFDSAQS